MRRNSEKPVMKTKQECGRISVESNVDAFPRKRLWITVWVSRFGRCYRHARHASARPAHRYHRQFRRSFVTGAFAAIIGIGAIGARADCSTGAPAGPVDWVNTYIGTGGGGVEYGGTMPLVTTPFGMTNWSAQTRQNRISVSSYAYEDAYIQGFIGTHQPAIWMGDYGYVTLMPEIGSINYAPEARRQPFMHQDEISTPYYYSVKMAAADPAHRIDADMTATDHAGYLRFRFPKGAHGSVLIEATRPAIKGFVAVNAEEREVTGYNPDRMDADLGPLQLPHFKGYFVVRFKQPFAAKTVYEGVLMWPDKTQVDGINVGAFVSFDTAGGDFIEARVGTSFISIEQARANLDQEIPDWNFERTCEALRTEWNRKLGSLSVEGADDEQRHIFYTGLYHALLYPKLFSEHGRYYSAFGDKVHDGTS